WSVSITPGSKHDRPPGRRRGARAGSGGLDAELLGGHARALEARGDLLHRHVAGEVGRAVLRLEVPAEGREATVVRRAEALDRDVLRRGDEVVADLLGGLDLGR